MPNIADFHQENIWQPAGDSLADHKKMQPPYQRGLLHLVYFLIYTQEGRQYAHAWIPGATLPGKGILTEEAVREELRQRFETEFEVTGAALEAVIAAHIAGFAWVDAHKAWLATHDASKLVERDKQEASYKQNIAAVSWYLWEEGVGHLFPLVW